MEREQACATVAMAIAAVLVGAVSWRLRRRRRRATAADGAPPPKDIKKGTTVTLWIMNNGPKPQEDTEAALKPFTAEDRRSRSRSSSSAGTSSSTASATRPSRARARTSRRPAPRRCRSSPRSAGSRTSATASPTSAGSRRTPEGVWKTTQVVGQDGTWAVPWFTEARVDLLPQGRAREGRRRPRDRVRRLGRVPRHAGEDQGSHRDRRQADRPVRLARARRRSTSSTT